MQTPIIPQRHGERIDTRDDIDRLVCVCVRHGHPLPAGTPRVLIAVDGTEISLELMRRLIAWQKVQHWSFEAHLLIVHDYMAKEAAERILADWGLEKTAAARALLDEAGLGHVLHITMGPPAQRILECAQLLDVAVIVMGTRGHGPLGSVLLGSVAYRVVQDADRPVTLLRA